MRFRRSGLPVVLILALAVGLGLLWRQRDLPKESAGTGGGEISGNVPEGFGPIPTVDTPVDAALPAIPRQPSGAESPPEVMRRLAARMSRETGGLQVVARAGGRRSVHLGGRFMQMSAAVTGADGKTEIRCFSNYQEMLAATTGNPAPAVPYVR